MAVLRAYLVLAVAMWLVIVPMASATTWVTITIDKLRPVNGRVWIYPNEDISVLLNQEEQEGCDSEYLSTPMLSFATSGTAEKITNLQSSILLYAAVSQATVTLKLEGCVPGGGPEVSDVTLNAPK